MPRRRPGGLTSHSTKFASVSMPDGSKLQIPQAKDAATFIYVADENGKWPKAPTTTLLVDLDFLAEGVTFDLEEMRPGYGMGGITTMQVLAVRNVISLFPGKYGQLKRLVLVTERLATDQLIEDLTLDQLGESLGGAE